MIETLTREHRFIEYLESIAWNRGVMDVLALGLGKPPGSVAEMYPYVSLWTNRGANPIYRDTCFLIAALFAYHPSVTRDGNFGEHLARACNGGEENTAVERRLTELLSARYGDLSVLLRQSLDLLKKRDVAVNWEQLFGDLLSWEHPDADVQKAWAKSFWEVRSAVSA